MHIYRGQRTILISLGLIFLLLKVDAQSELDIDLSLFGGSEYNIFNSPEVLLDRDTREPLPTDSIIYTDMFVDVEYDIEYQRTGDRSRFELGSNLWYRSYIDFSDLNQARISANGMYSYFLSEIFTLGGEYTTRWSDRIGTSVTGDLLMRSFKYFGNSARLFMDINPSDDLEMTLFGEYEYKDYYKENTRDPLDHGDMEISYSLDYEINRDHDFSFELSTVGRKYYEYHSLDSSGKYDELNPLRRFRYYNAQFDYNWTPIRGLRINPGIEAGRRIDLYNAYYSYLSYGASLRLRYMINNFYISLYGDYRQVEYDIRPAFTSLEPDPMLVYGYYDLQFMLRYSISDQWRVFLQLESDNRSSNTDLEYFKTRRPYKNYQVMVGVNYRLPAMIW